MNFKCLINLLKEKEYIKETKRFKVENLYQGDEAGSVFAINYKCKYPEVMDKIIDELELWHDNDELLHINYQIRSECRTKLLDKDEIKIIFTDKLENQIYELMGDDEQCYFEPIDVGYVNLTNFLFTEFYEFEYNSIHGKWYVIDLYKKKIREEEEEKEHEECLEFLKQLP